ncbi:Double zinc ribbon [Rubrobacter radiotolerans]|uniref:Double zinc ribbon n=1 Tax=Rubrobacter radiotolerans TaxID=42256 RepID=A0A023X494_RUBRA|nr:zinc ribbon domain-containing protein [Rubrobacter radiotolerans]AHY46825.1 Double zinc ribbon [Rubrobacter radiotolerans]MDX5894232.1 zinc ribbon domain-containing protein [Rubrobacter radiotolerans]SMC05519.1 Double zinc ribbon [Rubrobacter radiotolerans DSM 5868]
MKVFGAGPAVLIQQDADPFQFISELLTSPLLRISGQLLLLFIIVLWLALVYWTYADSQRRGALSILWGIVAVVFPFVGTLVYLIVRPPEYLSESRERELELAYLERELRSRASLCPNCRNMVENDYLICPVCNWELKKPCQNCERPLNMEWETCPYCSTDQRSGKKLI